MPPDGPCYRCVYAAPPPSGEPFSRDGVLGVLPGVMGILQAAEVVKRLTLAGDPLVGRMLVYDALAALPAASGPRAAADGCRA
jgi:sulfur-carrier protein adenylyltransferase/sulfurtransferase